jgi:hypothetical protein
MRPGGDSYPSIESWFYIHNSKCKYRKQDDADSLPDVVYTRRSNQSSAQGQSLHRLLTSGRPPSPTPASSPSPSPAVAADDGQRQRAKQARERRERLERKCLQLREANEALARSAREKMQLPGVSAVLLSQDWLRAHPSVQEVVWLN